MCGIAGFWSSRSEAAERLRAIVTKMSGTLVHRGPDAYGSYVAADAGLALGHRRLSILDLSAAGAQPMHSSSGRFILVLNGEIYNHVELRCELDRDVAFRGHSDTEVLLAAIEAWGLHRALTRCVGMFALALWDRESRRLSLARDRMGEKPLYYARHGGALMFASELRALRAHPEWAGQISPASVRSYLRFGYLPGENSIYSECKRLPPGAVLEFSAPAAAPAETRYWTLAEAAAQSPTEASEAEAEQELDTHLRRAIAGQMTADVPVGAFLSGGLDSSLVAGVMQALSARPVLTFTIGFEETAYNEAPYAARIARHLGTDHTEMVVTSRQAQEVIPTLPCIYDEPFADPSQVPTCLVAQLARRRVTVCLSGDAGDELFAGYSRYAKAARLSARVAPLPAWVRRAGGRAAAYAAFLPLVRRRGDAAVKLASFLQSQTAEAAQQATLSQFPEPETMLAQELLESEWRPQPLPGVRDLVEQLMYLDSITYLPDDILVKVDRAAMAVSLETRVPLLDHRLVEFAWRLPLSWKFRDGTGKRLLRRVLARYVPPPLFDRPKMGFGVPLSQWLRGPLREWAEDLLAPTRLRREAHFNPARVQAIWRSHLRGAEHASQLWLLLQFQAWLAASSHRPALSAAAALHAQ